MIRFPVVETLPPADPINTIGFTLRAEGVDRTLLLFPNGATTELGRAATPDYVAPEAPPEG